MENKEIARLLAETADLMEIGEEDGFRIRSYRNAAAAVESYPERIEDIVRNPERKLTEIPGIGKGIAAVLAIRPGTVGALLHHAHATLRRALEEVLL